MQDLRNNSDHKESDGQASIGQDMVEPMDAPVEINPTDGSDANVSFEGFEDDTKINYIGSTTQCNLI